MSNSTTTILVTAINNDGESQPFKVYVRKGITPPKGNSTLPVLVEPVTNDDGVELIRLNNWKAGLIVNHQAEWLEDVITGYRRDIDDKTYLLLKVQPNQELPSVKRIKDQDTY